MSKQIVINYKIKKLLRVTRKM
ncbi:hypothetical protein Gotur_007109 [Gossypium turneri]